MTASVSMRDHIDRLISLETPLNSHVWYTVLIPGGSQRVHGRACARLPTAYSSIRDGLLCQTQFEAPAPCHLRDFNQTHNAIHVHSLDRAWLDTDVPSLSLIHEC